MLSQSLSTTIQSILQNTNMVDHQDTEVAHQDTEVAHLEVMAVAMEDGKQWASHIISIYYK